MGHETEEAAARAYDRAALRLKSVRAFKLNFPLEDYLDVNGNLLPDLPKLQSTASNITSSVFRGVTFNKKRNNWMARIQAGSKSIFLGSYDIEDTARAYDRAAVRLQRKYPAMLNFLREDYLDASGALLSDAVMDAKLQCIPGTTASQYMVHKSSAVYLEAVSIVRKCPWCAWIASCKLQAVLLDWYYIPYF